jgi:ribokinase
MGSITVLGSINYDLVTSAARVPSGGETVAALNFETHHGGKGANQAIAVRRLSAVDKIDVRMIGRVGDDLFGQELLQGLQDEHIDVSHVSTLSKCPTGVATILVEPSGENRILVFPGANGTFTVEDLTDDLVNTDLLILQNEIPLPVVYAALKLAHSSGIKTVYNPSPMNDIPTEVFRSVDYLIVNSTEAQLLGDTSAINDNVDKAMIVLDELHAKLGCPSIIITLGGNGCVYKAGKETGYVPAAKAAKIVDTTGAGDTFLGSFAAQALQGESFVDAIQFAAKASAIAVSRPGAAEGIPRLEEVLALYK